MLSFLKGFISSTTLRKLQAISDMSRTWLNMQVPNNLPEAFCKTMLKLNTVD